MRFFIFFFVMIICSISVSAELLYSQTFIATTIGNSSPIISTAPNSQGHGGGSEGSSGIWCYNTTCGVGKICQDKHCVDITTPKATNLNITPITSLPTINSSVADNLTTQTNSTIALSVNSSATGEIIENRFSPFPMIALFLALALILGLFVYAKRKKEKDDNQTIKEALKDG